MGPGTLLCSFCEGDLRVFGVHMPFAKISKISDGRTNGRTDGRTDRRTFPIYGDRDVISASRNDTLTEFVAAAGENCKIVLLFC